jgi:hypothetical protein
MRSVCGKSLATETKVTTSRNDLGDTRVGRFRDGNIGRALPVAGRTRYAMPMRGGFDVRP